MAFDSALFASGFELFVARGKDLWMAAGEAVGGVRYPIAECRRTLLYDKRRFGPDGLLFERAIVAFELAIALRVVGRGEDVGLARPPTPAIPFRRLGGGHDGGQKSL